jgi:hypothetical protein
MNHSLRCNCGKLKGTVKVLRARLDGSYKQNPFFVEATGAPIVTPKVLNC